MHEEQFGSDDTGLQLLVLQVVYTLYIPYPVILRPSAIIINSIILDLNDIRFNKLIIRIDTAINTPGTSKPIL